MKWLACVVEQLLVQTAMFILLTNRGVDIDYNVCNYIDYGH